MNNDNNNGNNNGNNYQNPNQPSDQPPYGASNQPPYQNNQSYQDPNQPPYQNNQSYQAPNQPPYQNNQSYQGNPLYNGQPMNNTLQSQETPAKGLGIASLILGILSVSCCYFIIPSILGLIFSLNAKKQGNQTGVVKAGMILSIIGLVLGILFIILQISVGLFDGILNEYGFYY